MNKQHIRYSQCGSYNIEKLLIKNCFHFIFVKTFFIQQFYKQWVYIFGDYSLQATINHNILYLNNPIKLVPSDVNFQQTIIIIIT